MAGMTHCSACQRHVMAREARCPFCGGELIETRRWDGVVRGAKVGSLMLFTALTTTACYGGPRALREAPIDPGIEPSPEMSEVLPDFAGGAPTVAPTLEPPDYKIPSAVDTAYLYWSPKNGQTRAWSLKLYTTSLDGPIMRILAGGSGSRVLDLELELPPEGLPEAIGGVRQALPVEKMGSIAAVLRDPQNQALLFGLSTDRDQPTGTLQIADYAEDSALISGVLLLDWPQGTVQLYFKSYYSRSSPRPSDHVAREVPTPIKPSDSPTP